MLFRSHRDSEGLDPCDPLASVCAVLPRKPLRTRMRKAHTDDSVRQSTGIERSEAEPRWSLCPKHARFFARVFRRAGRPNVERSTIWPASVSLTDAQVRVCAPGRQSIL